MSKEKAIILFTVAIDVIGLGIIIPVLPVYVESFGLSAFMVTLLISVFSLFSFLSAPFLGALSDKYGRKPILIASIASTSLGWFVFAMAHSLPLLIIGRVIDGLAAGNFSTAQSSISDLAKDEKERAGSLGFIGMIFGLGFIIGPFIGGLLSKVSHSFPFYFVASMALINVILAFFFLPETNKHINHDKQISANPMTPLVAAAKNIKLRPLYIVWFLFNTIAVASNAVFALYLTTAFGYTPFTAGLFFTGVGVVIALNQGVLIKNFWLVRFKPKQLVLIMLGIFAVGFVLMALGNVITFIIGMILTALGQSATGVAMTTEVIGETDIKERGEAVGVLSGIASAATIVAPIIAGSIFQINYNLPFLFAAGLSLAAGVLMWQIKVRDRMSQKIEELADEVTA